MHYSNDVTAASITGREKAGDTPTAPPSTGISASLQHLQTGVDMYVPPVLVVLGVTGNILSLLVMRSRHFRKAPSGLLLCLLAAVDTGVLLTGPVRPLVWALAEINIRLLSVAACKIHYFATYLFTHVSSWTLVLVNIERLVSVTAPFDSRKICSKQRMLVAWVIMVTWLFAIDAHALWTVTHVERGVNESAPALDSGETTTVHDYSGSDISSSGEDGTNNETTFACKFPPERQVFGSLIWPWLDFAILSLVPFTTIVIINSIIWARIVRTRRRRLLQLHASITGTYRHQSSLTIMLLAVSTIFLITTTPITIYLLLYYYHKPETALEEEISYTLFVAFNDLYYLSNAVNFLLYCMSGSKFRRALLELCHCSQKCARDTGNNADSTPLHTRPRWSGFRCKSR